MTKTTPVEILEEAAAAQIASILTDLLGYPDTFEVRDVARRITAAGLLQWEQTEYEQLRP